ncbi:hypothetical protein C8R30_1045 [Nitrosomonas nitrosa]|uniref:hypothetical protein n=1 Tax=Nitrosomonas nitrosa TaxID=52442 RepID=UPI000D30B4B1|nr:hypothetical protein [Nitrosomonas nitrosa]PTR03454.1 hypothetical protein C8R30_1045 [Nitrosomonas nitrosa]
MAMQTREKWLLELQGAEVDTDCKLLLELASWFDRGGRFLQGDIMRRVADRHARLFDDYWKSCLGEEVKRELIVLNHENSHRDR